MKSHAFGFALLSATALVASAPAQAQNGTLTRSFVSSTGVDTNSCMITAPCQSFAEAYTKVGANGIVAALDPGKYGPLTITGSVTINGNGWAAITAPAIGPDDGPGTGITINAGPFGNVTLTGLEIDGGGAGIDGIVLNSGASLDVSNCVLQNLGTSSRGGNAILMQPGFLNPLNFTISNTTVSNVYNAGITFSPTGETVVHGLIDHVIITNANQFGIWINVPGGNGVSVVTISNSIVRNNNTGILVSNSGSLSIFDVIVDNVTVSGNGVGIEELGNPAPNVLLGRSVITGNSTGVSGAATNTFYTYKDNRINLNGTDGAEALNSFSQQ
jgi:hypothetical protein